MKQKTYPNGLRLVVETLKGFPSVVANITVAAGSNDDPERKQGVAHFLEHMAFKGTKTRTASEITNEFESVGSVMNASTSNNFIKFYVKCIAEDANHCFTLLSDIFLHATLPDEEIEKERQVILQELAMIEDDPERVVSELMSEMLYGNDPNGKPIGGYYETVSAITREDLLQFQQTHFVPSKTIISFAGNISFEQACKMVEEQFQTANLEQEPFVFSKQKLEFNHSKRYGFKQKQIMQNHVVISFPGVSTFHKHSVHLLMLSFFLGGGMSSRLFQRIREKHGLVYTIVAYNNSGIKVGNLEIYFATEGVNLKKAIHEIGEELKLIIKEGIPEDEFNKTKKFLKNLLLMMRENLDYIASSNAKEIFCYGKPVSVKTEIGRIEKIKKSEVEKLASVVFDPKKATIALVGNKPNAKLEKDWLKNPLS